MKPYFERGGITIYHGRAEDVLPTLEPSSVDLVLTDPPYGIGLENHGAANRRRTPRSWRIDGDMSADVGTKAVEFFESRAWAAIVFAHPMQPWPGRWRQHLVWDKGPAVGGGGDPFLCWKQSWELIQVARTAHLQGGRDTAVLRFWATPETSRLHPCAKPLPLIRYLIGKASAVGDLILDPFCGSGTTLRAAMDLGRRAIGIEIEEKYCYIAAKRLEQQTLFVPEPIREPAGEQVGMFEVAG